MNSIKQPQAEIVDSKMLLGWIKGKPYMVHNMQLKKVSKYGVAEYCSTDPFLHISTNVGMGDK